MPFLTCIKLGRDVGRHRKGLLSADHSMNLLVAGPARDRDWLGRGLATSYAGAFRNQKLMYHALVGTLFTRVNCSGIQTHSCGFRPSKAEGREVCDSRTQTDLRTFCSLFSRTHPFIKQTAVTLPLTSQAL